ncbi:glycosyltransferase family 2 protein [Pedobacter glucosidilyticus]|uniref:glycosyltransferase family 2 protein n=1 Tax=Pedobacter glucosidilyticus TaxID=1122941 RepID=UPI000423A319|nr:glycosyltransferase family 2 protein [Pedobacter glucosidilyticus]
MSKNILVSVIIPYYNNENVIEDTLFSLENQVYKNIEIIIIDDNSVLKLPSLKKFKHLNILYKKNKENLGASVSRNIGLSYAKGELIQYLDADDIISANKISKQVEAINYKLDSIAFGDWCYFEALEDLENINNQNKYFKKQFISCDYLYELNNYFDRMMPIHSYLIPKKIIDKSTGWDETITLGDDGEFMNRIIPFANELIYTPNCYSFYRRGNIQSLSHRRDFKSTISSLKCTESYEKVIKTFYPKNNNLIESIIYRYTLNYHIFFDDKINGLFIKNKVKNEYKSKFSFIGSKRSIWLQKVLGLHNYLVFKKLLKKYFG